MYQASPGECVRLICKTWNIAASWMVFMAVFLIEILREALPWQHPENLFMIKPIFWL